MTVAIILVSLALLAVAGLLARQVYRGDSRADQLLNEWAAHQTSRARLERAEFELKTTQASLVEANQRIAMLTAAAEKVVDEPANADLAPGDVDARRVRAALRAKAAEARRGGSLSADATEAMSPARTEAGTDAAGLPASGLLGLDEVLR